MIYKAPQNIDERDHSKPSIFLAGTIDMGNSEDWQSVIGKRLNEMGIDVFNPRRDDWDSSWKQEVENEQFLEQVTWELNSLEKAQLILFVFLADSESPITLLELGLHASSGKCVVVCPKEFYRSGNVEIVCNKFNIPLYKDIKSFKIN